MSSTRRTLAIAAVAAAAVAATLVTALPAPAADYGPDTCRVPYVWRDAFPGDHVCVDGRTRDQAASDNAAAGARRVSPANPTCLSPFVWREARASDLVCVLTATRTQTANDNASRESRRNALDVRLTRVTQRAQPNCEYDPSVGERVCTTTNTTSLLKVYADRINVGRAIVRLYKPGNRVTAWSVNVPKAPGRPGGAMAFKTNIGYCAGDQRNAYFTVQDPVSKRISRRAWIRYCLHL